MGIMSYGRRVSLLCDVLLGSAASFNNSKIIPWMPFW